MAAHPLDNAVWWSLTGPNRHVALQQGRAVRFQADVSVFSAVPDEPTERDWADLAALHRGDETVALFRVGASAPSAWHQQARFTGVQFVAPPGAGIAQAADGLVVLGPADVPEMAELVAATEPGPFAPRTVELGAYVGIRSDGGTGELLAMAGQRLRLEGHVELSAVCTAVEHRGRGLARRLVRHLVALIEAEGNVAFLHAQADNAPAVALYDALGFERRTEVDALLIAPPT